MTGIRRGGRAARMAAAATLAVALLGGPAWVATAKDKVRKTDIIWVHPGFDSLGVNGVALLPAASFDKNHQNEKLVEGLFAEALRPSGYRWVRPLVAKTMIRATLGDSALAALDQSVLKAGRPDSLEARRLCRVLRTDALMSMRVDLFEQTQVEWNQSGKPTTTVRLRAALVDSAGRLLWSASGSETGEGAYHEADAGTMGVKGSGLNTKPVTAESSAPSFEEVTTRLLARWMQQFPARKAADAPTPP
jgi:hypothetical protein